jgi:hypothetical protein
VLIGTPHRPTPCGIDPQSSPVALFTLARARAQLQNALARVLKKPERARTVSCARDSCYDAGMLGRARMPFFVLLLALACGSCTTTPTLPLPPPVASVDLPDSEGFALVQGQVQALAYVSVLNENSDEGVITRSDNEGNFKTRIAAESGDLLTIWQDLGDGVASEQKHLTVPGKR